MSRRPNSNRKARITQEQIRAQGTTVADAVTHLVTAAIRHERKRNRWFLFGTWAAMVLSAVLGVLF